MKRAHSLFYHNNIIKSFLDYDNKIVVFGHFSFVFQFQLVEHTHALADFNEFIFTCPCVYSTRTKLDYIPHDTYVQGVEGDDVIDKALKEPERFVAKPQREGGGNVPIIRICCYYNNIIFCVNCGGIMDKHRI